MSRPEFSAWVRSTVVPRARKAIRIMQRGCGQVHRISTVENTTDLHKKSIISLFENYGANTDVVSYLNHTSVTNMSDTTTSRMVFLGKIILFFKQSFRVVATIGYRYNKALGA